SVCISAIFVVLLLPTHEPSFMDMRNQPPMYRCDKVHLIQQAHDIGRIFIVIQKTLLIHS
ncbi:hypothetical protein RXP26_29930, partial [Pseudomonas aeruginosa]|nr:hypothetical protein [Pseudomonas aeruginosa]